MSVKVVAKTAQAAAAPTLARSMSSMDIYSAKQTARGRPISPHVSIYRLPVGGVTSIANRFAAIGMSAAFVGGSALGLVGADVPGLIYAAQDLIPLFGPVSKSIVAFPIAYYVLYAARHTLWLYKPELINTEDAPVSCYALFTATGIITLGASCYTIETPKEVEEK